MYSANTSGYPSRNTSVSSSPQLRHRNLTQDPSEKDEQDFDLGGERKRDEDKAVRFGDEKERLDGHEGLDVKAAEFLEDVGTHIKEKFDLPNEIPEIKIAGTNLDIQ